VFSRISEVPSYMVVMRTSRFIDMHDILPAFAIELLQDAFARWQQEVPLFIGRNAVLMAAETRTSSPVRIIRNEQYESINSKNLFPIGEGSGYTGGITSSAADGLRAVAMRHI